LTNDRAVRWTQRRFDHIPDMAFTRLAVADANDEAAN
jgi:hypothetical protein